MVWPCYFDLQRSRRHGRRVPKRLCTDNPKIEEIAEAARLLGLPSTTNAEARHPRFWWQKSGYLVIRKSETKEIMLHMLAGKIAELHRKPASQF